MTGTIEKQNKDGSLRLISIPTGWILEDSTTGEVIDETNDYLVRNGWVSKYKLSRNVGQFWYKEDDVMSGYKRNADSINAIFDKKDSKSIKSSRRLIKSETVEEAIMEAESDIIMVSDYYDRDGYINEYDTMLLRNAIETLEEYGRTTDDMYRLGKSLLNNSEDYSSNKEHVEETMKNKYTVPFSVRIKEVGPRVTTYTTITGDTKDECYDKVYQYFKSNQYSWQVDRTIENDEIKKDYSDWVSKQGDKLWWKHATGRDFD